MSSNTPLRTARLVALLLSAAWGIIAGSIGLSGLIKSNQSQSAIRKLAPPPIKVSFDITDVYHSGVVATTVAALIALLSTIFILALFIAPNRFIRLQATLLAFCSVWLAAVEIPFDHFVATRSAIVTASINGIVLPSSVIQSAEKSLGVTGVYRHIHYLVLVAIFPWFTVLFGAIAAGVLFAASKRSAPTPPKDGAVPLSEKHPSPSV